MWCMRYNFLSLPIIDPVSVQGMDIDLRQLPVAIAKKRPSTEIVEAIATKKSKTEMFDV